MHRVGTRVGQLDEEILGVKGGDFVERNRNDLRRDEINVAHDFEFDVASLNQDDELFQATYWHNRLFNPTLPGQVRILEFIPRL